jgi:hypothetical protein
MEGNLKQARFIVLSPKMMTDMANVFAIQGS